MSTQEIKYPTTYVELDASINMAAVVLICHQYQDCRDLDDTEVVHLRNLVRRIIRAIEFRGDVPAAVKASADAVVRAFDALYGEPADVSEDSDRPPPSTNIERDTEDECDCAPTTASASTEDFEPVTVLRETKERSLELLDELVAGNSEYDQRCVDLARTHIQMGYSFAVRPVFQPKYIRPAKEAAVSAQMIVADIIEKYDLMSVVASTLAEMSTSEAKIYRSSVMSAGWGGLAILGDAQTINQIKDTWYQCNDLMASDDGQVFESHCPVLTNVYKLVVAGENG